MRERGTVVALLRMVAATAMAAGCIGLPAHGQGTAGTTRHKTGMLPPDPARTAHWPTETLTRAYIPDAIDLTALMPPVENQEGLAACVSFATAYAVRGYYSAIETGNDPGDRRFTPSPAFVHTQIFRAQPGESCAEAGSATSEAMDFLAASGTPDFDSVPTDMACAPGISGSRLPRNQFSIAGGSKIVEGARVTDYHVNTMKQRLAAGHPVVVGFDLFKSEPGDDVPATLQLLRPQEVYQGSLGSNAGPEKTGHAMVFVGYDERRKAFRVQNSWGTTWADAGFGWISYEATKADLTAAYTMKTAVPPPVPVPQRPEASRPQMAGTPPCSSLTLTYEVRDKTRHPRIEGFVSSFDMLDALDQQFGFDAVSAVEIRPWPVCEALLTLGDPLDAPSRPVIAVDDSRDHLKYGDVLGFGVTTPNFPSFLYVVYLQADGTVLNLVPRRGPIRKQLPPGTTLRFGDGRDGRQTFRVSAPEGPEAIIAIASRSPLHQLEALETEANGQFRLDAVLRGHGNQDNAQDRLWLSLLREAMLDRPAEDMIAREVTADVVHVTVSAN